MDVAAACVDRRRGDQALPARFAHGRLPGTPKHGRDVGREVCSAGVAVMMRCSNNCKAASLGVSSTRQACEARRRHRKPRSHPPTNAASTTQNRRSRPVTDINPQFVIPVQSISPSLQKPPTQPPNHNHNNEHRMLSHPHRLSNLTSLTQQKTEGLRCLRLGRAHPRRRRRLLLRETQHQRRPRGARARHGAQAAGDAARACERRRRRILFFEERRFGPPESELGGRRGSGACGACWGGEWGCEGEV